MRPPQTLAPRRCYYAWLTGAALAAVAGAAPASALPPTTRGPSVQGPDGASDYPRLVLDANESAPVASRPAEKPSRQKSETAARPYAPRATAARAERTPVAGSRRSGTVRPVLFVKMPTSVPRTPAARPTEQIVPGQLPSTQPARGWIGDSNETSTADSSASTSTANSDMVTVPLPSAPTTVAASARPTPVAAPRPPAPGRKMASLPKSMQPSLSRPPLTPSELLEAAAVSRSRNFRLAQQRINYNTFSGGSPYEKLVALTFDDGPDPLQTPRVLQVLRQHKVTATFFVIGSKVDENPELTQRVAAEGHDLGNHTYHHYNMSTFNEEGVRFQVERTSQSIEKAVGGPTRWFRAPGCRYTPEVLRVLRDLDMVRVDTTNNTGDWAKRDPAAVVRAVMNRLKPGDVILCHDRLPLTTKALPALIRAVRARGYRFVSLAELAQRAQASNFTPVSWPVNQGVVLDDPRRRAIRVRSKRKVRFSLASMENPGITMTADAAGSRDSVQVRPARRRTAHRKVRRRIQRDRETRRLTPARRRTAPTVQMPRPAKPLIPRTVVVPAPARVRPVLPPPIGRVPSSILTGLAEG